MTTPRVSPRAGLRVGVSFRGGCDGASLTNTKTHDSSEDKSAKGAPWASVAGWDSRRNGFPFQTPLHLRTHALDPSF